MADRRRRTEPLTIPMARGFAKAIAHFTASSALLRAEDIEDIASEAYFAYWRTGERTGRWDNVIFKRRVIDQLRKVSYRRVGAKLVHAKNDRRCVSGYFADFPDRYTSNRSRPLRPEEYLDPGVVQHHEVEFEDLVDNVVRHANVCEKDRLKAIVRLVASGSTMREAGEQHGLTESRVCQLFGVLKRSIRERGIFNERDLAGRSRMRIERQINRWTRPDSRRRTAEAG